MSINQCSTSMGDQSIRNAKLRGPGLDAWLEYNYRTTVRSVVIARLTAYADKALDVMEEEFNTLLGNAWIFGQAAGKYYVSSTELNLRLREVNLQ